jgi:xanthine/CO dehydrogenase XdhC/CoxF family maturation factor
MSMRERRLVVALAAQSREGALVSLVRTSGSSYRRPGARLLTLADGTFAGTISGGCLEADLLRKAAWKIREGAVVENYSTAFDDTAEIPYGLGCGGEVDLLLEPLNTPEAEALLQTLQASLRGETLRCATRLPSEGTSLARIIVNTRGDVIFASEHLETEDIVAIRHHLLRSPEAIYLHRDSLFLEEIRPPQRLLLFGAGEDAKPVVECAANMGWSVTVIDRRPQFARSERFPLAHNVVTSLAEVQPEASQDDAIVLMTHSFEEDLRLLAETLPLEPRYLGLLGARHRSSLLLLQAAPMAGLSLAEACSRVHAPIGLDLGGDGPESIALAIVAEIQAVLTQRPAGMRGMTENEVHEQIASHGPTVPPSTSCAVEPGR